MTIPIDEMEELIGIREMDVLIGLRRGRKGINHPGNRSFKALIESNIDRYRATKSRKEMRRMKQEIYECTKKLNGRFMVYDKTSKAWGEVSLMHALEKIGEAFQNMQRPRGMKTKKETKGALPSFIERMERLRNGTSNYNNVAGWPYYWEPKLGRWVNHSALTISQTQQVQLQFAGAGFPCNVPLPAADEQKNHYERECNIYSNERVHIEEEVANFLLSLKQRKATTHPELVSSSPEIRPKTADRRRPVPSH